MHYMSLYCSELNTSRSAACYIELQYSKRINCSRNAVCNGDLEMIVSNFFFTVVISTHSCYGEMHWTKMYELSKKYMTKWGYQYLGQRNCLQNTNYNHKLLSGLKYVVLRFKRLHILSARTLYKYIYLNIALLNVNCELLSIGQSDYSY